MTKTKQRSSSLIQAKYSRLYTPTITNVINLTDLSMSLNCFHFTVIQKSSALNIMKVITIGEQVWAKKDLKVFRFRNGDLIPIVQSPEAWMELETSAMCINPDTGKVYYNWWAVNDPRGLAPEGWRIPTIYDWEHLIESLGGRDIAGAKMKTKHGRGNNQSGFSGKLNGWRNDYNGNFTDDCFLSCYWSSTEYSGAQTWHFGLGLLDDEVRQVRLTVGCGLSVRCLLDT